MGFFTTFKQKMNLITTQMFIGQSPIEPLIKENRQMLEAELKLSLESTEGIQALKEYSEIETPVSKEALNNTSEVLKNIEKLRQKLVEQLRIGFVRPFEQLSNVWKEVEIMKKEKERAEKALEHAQKILEKKKEKKENTPEKMKENELESAEQSLSEAKSVLKEISEKLEQKEENFHNQKLKVIQNSLKVLIRERKSFHSTAKNSLENIKNSILAIKVRNEGKLYAELDNSLIQEMKEDNADTIKKGEKEEKTSFKSKIYSLTERITKTDLELSKVIRENKQILEAHAKLMKETTEGIAAYKKYAEIESPDIQSILNRFAGALETIETNRQAFIEQMKFEFLEPLEKLSDEYKNLQDVIKQANHAEEILIKCQKKLKKLQEKPEEKRKPEALPDAEQALEEAKSKSEVAKQKLESKTLEYGIIKAKTLKDSLKSLVERNYKFHEQAYNIIQNAEILVKS
ncbi:hypothetical protein [Candidatus Harpocratesius sp.]